jgi:putative transposase
MRAYSQDLRDRVFADSDAGLSFAELGRKYRVSAEWVRQVVRRRERTGETAPRPAGPKKRPFHERHEADLRRETAANPSHTLETLRAALGLDVSIGTLWAALRALKITFKKKRWSRPSRLALMSPPSGPSSTPGGCRSTRTGSSSSTRRG